MLTTIFLCLMSFIAGLLAKKYLLKLFVIAKNKKEEIEENEAIKTEDNKEDEYETDFEDEDLKMVYFKFMFLGLPGP
jgi:hypothetical protein